MSTICEKEPHGRLAVALPLDRASIKSHENKNIDQPKAHLNHLLEQYFKFIGIPLKFDLPAF